MFFAGHSRTPLVNLLALVSIGLLFIMFYSKSRSALFALPTTASSKPRYIFVNLGVGSGESLEVFLKNSETKSDLPKPEWAEYHDAGKCFDHYPHTSHEKTPSSTTGSTNAFRTSPSILLLSPN